MQPSRRGTIIGFAAAIGACVIGAGWQVATRLGTTTTLAPVDLALLRYCIPAVLQAPTADVILQACWQGVIAGLLGLWTFALGVHHIGPSRAAAVGALVPVLSALGGGLVLGEIPKPLVLAGILCTMVGVYLASGVLARKS
ncbi:EamA family transporter [Ferrovibrio sp.]|uniref:EamA family transporter n=1 Tax=Ferrovibrio sp. TaxID=1917215 RepID=UPI0026034088|nr:EamA family transporter [Ferrovibrio sp.]